MLKSLEKSQVLICNNEYKKRIIEDNNNLIKFDFQDFFNSVLNLNILDEEIIFYLFNKELYNSCLVFEVFDNEKSLQREIYVKEFLDFYYKLRRRCFSEDDILSLKFKDLNDECYREDFLKLFNFYVDLKKKYNFCDYYDFLDEVFLKVKSSLNNDFFNSVLSFKEFLRDDVFCFDLNELSNLEIDLLVLFFKFLNDKCNFIVFYNKVCDRSFFEFEVSRFDYFKNVLEKNNLNDGFDFVENNISFTNKNSTIYINKLLKENFSQNNFDLEDFSLDSDFYKGFDESCFEESFACFACTNEFAQFGKILDIISKNSDKKVGIVCPNDEVCFELSYFFDKKNISSNLSFKQDLLKFKEFREIVNLFKILNPDFSDIVIYEVLEKIFNNKEKLSLILKKLKKDFYFKFKEFVFFKDLGLKFEVLDEEIFKFLNENVDEDVFEKLKDFVVSFSRVEEENCNILKFKKIVSEFGFIKRAIENKNKKLIYFLKLFYKKLDDLSKTGLDLEIDFFDFLKFETSFFSKDYSITIVSYESFYKNYKFKSLNESFDVVVLPYLNERIFPSNFKRNSFDKFFNQTSTNFIKDELSLFLSIFDFKFEGVYFLNIETCFKNKNSIMEKSFFLNYLDVCEEFFNKEVNLLNSNVDENLDIEDKKKDGLGKFFEIEQNVNNSKKDNKLVYLSATKIQNYLNCPKKYEYNYFIGLPSPYRFYFSFGTSIHDTLEILVKDFIYDQDINDENVLFSKFITILTQKWISKGYDCKNQEKLYFEKAIKLSKNLIKTELERKKRGFKIDKAEEKIEYEIDYLGVKILGFVDRVDKIGDDFVILDYKTSKSKKSVYDLRKDVQLFLYKYFYKVVKGKSVKSVGLWFLIFNEIVEIELKDIDDEFILENIKKVAQGIRDKKFNPQKSKLCDYCEYKDICKDYWEM